jgi:hypothetical protein
MAGRVVRESSDPTWIRSLSTRGSFFRKRNEVAWCMDATEIQSAKSKKQLLTPFPRVGTTVSVPATWAMGEDMQRGFIGEPFRGLEAASSDSGGLLGSAPASQLVPGGHG